jgi:hypothetical protein
MLPFTLFCFSIAALPFIFPVGAEDLTNGNIFRNRVSVSTLCEGVVPRSPKESQGLLGLVTTIPLPSFCSEISG